MGEVLFTTNDVAGILRVDKSTVKRWTDEGKLKCFRTPGGHRKFHADDVYAFMNAHEYDSQSIQALPKMMSDEMIINAIVHRKEFNVLHSVCFSSAIKGRKEEIIALFRETLAAGASITDLFDNVLRPTTRKLEHLVSLEKLTVSEFHLAINVLTSAVILLHQPPVHEHRNKRTIVCVSQGDRAEEAELAALAVVLERNGYAVMNLGSGVTPPAITQFLTRTKPYAVVIYSSFPSSANETAQIISIIAESAKANGTRCLTAGALPTHASLFPETPLQHCTSFAEASSLQFELVHR